MTFSKSITIGKRRREVARSESLQIAIDPGEDHEAQAIAREYRSLVRKFWFAAAISVPVMLVAYPELPWLYLPNLFVREVSESLIQWFFILSAVISLTNSMK